MLNNDVNNAINNAVQLIKTNIVESIIPPLLITHKFVDMDALMSLFLLKSVISTSTPVCINVEPDNYIKYTSQLSNPYIGCDLTAGFPNCIGHNNLDDNWSSCSLIFKAFNTIPEISSQSWLKEYKNELEFLVDYSTRAEQRVLSREERGKNSLVSLLYGLRSQQDLISDSILFDIFEAILSHFIITPGSATKNITVSEDDLIYNIYDVIKTIPIFETNTSVKEALVLSKLGTRELIHRYVEFKTLENGMKVAINRSCHNLIRPLFSDFMADIVLFENKYRRVGLVSNIKSNMNLGRLFEFLKDKDERWKYIKESNLISKKVSIDEFDTDKKDESIDVILGFLNTMFTKEGNYVKNRRISHFD